MSFQKHCLETIDALEYGKNVMESIELRARLGDETRKLLDKRIETAERYSRKRKLFVEEDTETDETSTSRR